MRTGSTLPSWQTCRKPASLRRLRQSFGGGWLSAPPSSIIALRRSTSIGWWTRSWQLAVREAPRPHKARKRCGAWPF